MDEDAQAGLEVAAASARQARETVEARRAALGRYALVWWHGVAADRYRELVEERRARLAALAEALADLEAALVALRDAERAARTAVA